MYNYSFSHIALLLALALIGSITPSLAQTTWTESAVSYVLNIGSNKDGGHAWGDFDQDGDIDLGINRNDRSFIYRNNGNNTFSDITATNAPALSSGGAYERTFLWGDLNNDGWLDFVRNTSGGIQVYLQDQATNIFGNGTGGTTPQTYNGSQPVPYRITDGVNTEGMGLMDYNGDGYIDIIFDNHNYGVDMLENLGNGYFTHVTPKDASYDVNDPSTWPLGLVQDATDGDYGSTTDYDNDGYVDFIARKRNQVDFFQNIAGSFTGSINIDDANNSNKGGVNFSDFDNDGDFDLFWTEQGDNQIFENQNGVFVALGAGTGIPVSFSSNIDGLACGDVDNDGDIDIFLAGDSRGHLFINQINDPLLGANNGAAMDFVQSSDTFYSGDGEGCTFADIDNDGDLDLYVNIMGNNKLYVNQLSGTPSNNYLFVDIKEDRAVANMPAGVTRDALGATLKLVDCDGNVISGIREINGGNGHGTQDLPRIHFGLPAGPDDFYILQASYPHISGEPRLQINVEIRPSDFSSHLYEIVPSNHANDAPVGGDDTIGYGTGIPETFDPMIDNGGGIDYDPDADPIFIPSILASQPSNGTAVVNGDQTITYTPNAGFTGNDTFSYYINDNPPCPAAGLVTTATVTMTFDCATFVDSSPPNLTCPANQSVNLGN